MDPHEPDKPVVWDASRTREYFASIQDENGVDLTLIRENLRRTPAERIRCTEAGADDARRLNEYGRRARQNQA